jgi:hypothetical protein
VQALLWEEIVNKQSKFHDFNKMCWQNQTIIWQWILSLKDCGEVECSWSIWEFINIGAPSLIYLLWTSASSPNKITLWKLKTIMVQMKLSSNMSELSGMLFQFHGRESIRMNKYTEPENGSLQSASRRTRRHSLY